MSNNSFGGHPKGLYLLFTVEMWERMSYYGMRALLTLYMVSKTTDANPGFGMSTTDALKVYAWYTGLVYATPLLGGYLADKYLGQRKAVYIGGVLMMIGHFLMAVPGMIAFYAALIFLIIGNGFFKPNISTMVGGLYEEGDSRRDSAFTIFYMGINLGAVLAGLVCGSLGEKIGFHWGFGAAGVGMLIGLVTFSLLANKMLPEGLGVLEVKEDQKEEQASAPLTSEEIDRITVIFILSIFVMFFWAAFEQAGGLMNIYTMEKVDRVIWGFEVPASWFQSLNPAIIFIFAPLFSKLWTTLGNKGIDPPTPVKMAFGLILLSFGFIFMLHGVNQADSGHTGLASLFWLVGAYFWHTMGELCLSPIGLSMVTKLAPAHLTALMMGVWFASNFISNLAAGYIGGYAEKLGEFQLFSLIVVATASAGIVLFFLARPIIKMMHMDSEDNPAYGFKTLSIMGVVCAALFYLYPMTLSEERKTDTFSCQQTQREAKANFYRIMRAQREQKEFVSLEALNISLMPEELTFSQQEILNTLSSAFNTQNKHAGENNGAYIKDLKVLIPHQDALPYSFDLQVSDKGFTLTSTRKADHAMDEDTNLEKDRWSINQDGVVQALNQQLKYKYELTHTKDKFTLLATSIQGKQDAWEFTYQQNALKGEFKNTTNRCE